MNYSTLTVEDCIRKQEQEGKATVIENGAVTGFVEDGVFPIIFQPESNKYKGVSRKQGSNIVT